MNEAWEFTLRAIAIGAGATIVLDLWALLQRRILDVPGPNWSFVGRWIGHFPRGRFKHDSIAAAEPVHGEQVIGWVAHYVTGVCFAALLLAIFGLDWARAPTLLPALIVGVATVAAPFFLMQPGMGAGVAASKTPKPGVSRARSVMAHAVFGLGLYAAGLLTATLIPS